MPASRDDPPTDMRRGLMTGLTASERLKANRVASARLDALEIGDVYGLAHDALVAQYAGEPDGRERLASDFENLIGEDSEPESEPESEHDMYDTVEEKHGKR